MLDPDFARRTYPQAVAALSNSKDACSLAYFDHYLYLMDVVREGYSCAVWLARNEIWVPHVRRIA
jgi:hypothetical protein